MNENLIVLEQLPIIKTHLEKLSLEIKKKVDSANSLLCTEETYKDVKQVRANLNKEFNDLETQRKQVKQAIMSKYDEFEEIYKENVSNLYKTADEQLKQKILNVENELKQEKTNELIDFANEHIKFNDLQDIINFEDIGLNITLSSSIKSLKEQILTFIEKIANDIKLINLEEYKDEILLEYKKNLDFTISKMEVIIRHKQLEELKEKEQAKDELQKQEEKIIEKVEEVIEEITVPKEIIEDNEILVATFTINDTKENIIKVRDFMRKEGINYE